MPSDLLIAAIETIKMYQTRGLLTETEKLPTEELCA